MSKVQLQGNVSGTGIFTIASPNSNINRTLTLPDNTGTLLTQNSQPSFASTIGVGGATPAASGVGITFPATASPSSDANTLDDYEEGSWTVVLTPETSGSITLSTNFGRYTKIGNRVILTGYIVISSTSSPVGGNVKISGLPFTPTSNTAFWTSGAARYNGMSSGMNSRSLHISQFAPTDTRFEVQSAGSTESATATYFVANADIEFMLIYATDL